MGNCLSRHGVINILCCERIIWLKSFYRVLSIDVPMESFLKSLSLNSTTAEEDVTYNCAKLLDWVYKTSSSPNQLIYKDVENIGKAIIYLNSCYELFGEQLPSRILQQYPVFGKSAKIFFNNSATDRFTAIARIFENVADRKSDELEHIFTLEMILNASNDSNEDPISLEYTTADEERSSSAIELHTLIQKVFQLPNEQVDIAIDRILNFVPFSIIGLIFCEPENSFYTDACWILAHKINEKLIDGNISKFFIRSLYHLSSISQSGKQFYWICLKNTTFAKAITLFFIRILSQLSNNGYNFNITVEKKTVEQHRLTDIYYLIWAALSPWSPCHSDLYTQCIKYKFLLNKFDRIFE